VEGLFTLPALIAGITLIALTAYALTGGADFGGGVWDLLASGPRREAQRELITHAIGPIWEANHVWLILVVVLLFTCFPPVFSGLAVVLHIPLTLMLIGIVMRGSAFTFRTYGAEENARQERWGRAFAIASVVTPLLLGVCLGAVASGEVGRALALVEQGSRVGFSTLFLAPWLTAFAVGVGVLALAAFAFLAAVYLTVEAQDEALREDFRRRSLGAAVAVAVVAGVVLALSHEASPVRSGLIRSRWAIPFQAITVAVALVAIWALLVRRFRLARVAAAAQVMLILWGWAVAQYPYLVPPVLTVYAAAAPARTLRLAVWGLIVGGVLLLPSLVYLFRIFKGRPDAFARLEKRRPDEPGT
jgi:cytochrome d ubiquinol oxidase subunit II